MRLFSGARSALATVGLIALLTVPITSAAADPYEINTIVSLTGPGSFLGQEAAQTLRIIEKTVNRAGGIDGRPLKFVIADDQSNPQIAVQLATAVLAKKAPIIIGSDLVAICNALAPLVKNGPVLYCLSPGIHPDPGSYVFSSGVSTADTLAAAVNYFHFSGWTRVAIITSSDATGQDADRVIDAVFHDQNPSASIVAHEHFNTTDISVSAQMAKISASGANVLIAWTTGTPLGTILRGAADGGLTIPILTTAGNMTYAQMNAYSGFMPKMLLFPSTPAFAPEQLPNGALKNAVRAFADAMKSDGARPENGSALTWDGTLTIVAALRKLGLGAGATEIRDYIDNVRGDVGIYGEHDFRAVPQRGVGIKSVVMARWDAVKGTWVGVSRPPRQ